MKKIKVDVYRNYKQEMLVEVVNEIHDLPTWMFPESMASTLKTPCPICRQEMRLNIAHGTYIGTCSYIELSNGHCTPIHTECFNSTGNPDYGVNHFNQAEYWKAGLTPTPITVGGGGR